ncbi:MAG: beta-N-acetylhexosaminidase [Kiritimatiellae bacterium]|nr:beta-N-acetylhexosaminidase [Kiritimatiellia bacterium]
MFIRHCSLFATLVLTLSVASVAPAAPQLPALVPQPAHLAIPEAASAFTLTADTAIVVVDSAFTREAEFAAKELRLVTGLPLPVVQEGEGGIRFERSTEALPREGYTLTVSETAVTIAASDPAGAFYGYQTVRQLLPPQVYAKRLQEGIVWEMPACTIADAPRLAWRGLMVDDVRHFIGGDGIRQMIDVMAAHKMNTLHWHLTDDQGWRIEIRKYPELITKGAIRDNSAKPRDRWRPDGKPYGPYFYTQAEIRAIVAYAAERHITIVPEIEMPGHALALLSAFPELSCTGGPFKPRWLWGVEPDILCAGNDAVFPFMKDILDEVMLLFPSKFIHLGGDEAPKDRWNVCEKCQKRIQEKGLRNSHHLQTWFIQQFADYLEANDRHLIGWDEILEGGLPSGAAVMSWRGMKGGIAAAKMGHPVVMAPNDFCYLDYGQGIENDPYEYNIANVPLRKVYTMNPTDGIPEMMHRYIIGVQGNLWSEYIWDAADQQWKAWPRAAAIAEIGWTPQDKRQWKTFAEAMERDYQRLKVLGINAAPADLTP